MTTYEKLKQLLNDADLQRKLTDHLNCDKARLKFIELDKIYHELDLQVIQIVDDREVLKYTDSFAFELNDLDSLFFFAIRFKEYVSPRAALEIAKTGQLIEDHLRASL